MRLYSFFGLHAMRFFVQHYAPNQRQSLIQYNILSKRLLVLHIHFQYF
ncbi:hypothetical protein [Bartonella machadoae]|nr:hypothetical protein [Bartonella machadoae]UNE54670.1 hypothetical protein LNM86_01915 [Bartonella machadoae]